jgi:cytidyltransferase-like protein
LVNQKPTPYSRFMFNDGHHDDIDSFRPVSIVSGGFDPVHSGHVALLEGAARLGNVVVILNSDQWLTRKKGKPFMCWDERATILRSIRWVREVVRVDDSDETVCDALRSLKERFTGDKWSPSLIFCNGGDRTATTTPERDLCADLGFSLAWNVGGGKTHSSSDLLRNWA